ncbi:porin [Roseivivax isoporae]|uniref:Porin n=1 Tax=Roseivivax isoporae LMG 25204 TaxID=1449351 RepID=X7FB49_9RHOB|nr:porin [Roseivivax isoporae]ETX30000.1 porin [Roseivivax isoporae LMG 25204]
MKKLLFASTALVASAGIASAQDLGVALTGMAEMGIYKPAGAFGFDANGDVDFGDSDTQFFTDIDVTFTMTGEADNGLSFGASIDIDEAGNGQPFESPNTQGGETIFVSFGGATLTMGDTDGAMDAALPEMGLAGGSLNDDETAHIGFNDGDGYSLYELLDTLGTINGGFDSGLSLDGNGDGQIARFDYAYSSFVFSLSMEQAEDGADDYLAGNNIGVTAGFDANPIYGVGVAYAGEFSGVSIDAGIAYQTQEDVADTYGLAVAAGFASGLSVGATYAQSDVADEWEDNIALQVPGFAIDNTITHWGLGVGYSMNNIAVGLNYGEYSNDDFEASGYGLAATYDLGGGLSLRGGYSNNTLELDGAGEDDYDTFSLGLRMNF